MTGRALLAELRAPARLDQMNARELARMHGSLFDRAFRMLGGLAQDCPELPQGEARQGRARLGAAWRGEAPQGWAWQGCNRVSRGGNVTAPGDTGGAGGGFGG